MRSDVRRLLILVTAGVAMACAAGSNASGGPKTRTDPSRMDSTELRGHNYGSVYDAISAKHADWFQPKGGATTTQIAAVAMFIYGETRPRELKELRDMRVEDIMSVRHLSASESNNTYSWPFGAIVVYRH